MRNMAYSGDDIGFAGFERVAEDADDLIRARLVQQNPDDLVEVATDDPSRNVAEHRQSDGVYFANAEVRIHQVHAQRRLVEEHLELRGAMAQRLRGLAAYAGDLDVRRDVSQQLAGAERLDQVVVGSRRQSFQLWLSSSARAESRMIGNVLVRGSARRRAASPVPSRRGIMTSLKTRSGNVS